MHRYNRIQEHRFLLVCLVRLLRNRSLQGSLYIRIDLIRLDMYQINIFLGNLSHKDSSGLLGKDHYKLLSKNQKRRCLLELEYLLRQHKRSLDHSTQ